MHVNVFVTVVCMIIVTQSEFNFVERIVLYKNYSFLLLFILSGLHCKHLRSLFLNYSLWDLNALWMRLVLPLAFLKSCRGPTKHLPGTSDSVLVSLAAVGVGYFS